VVFVGAQRVPEKSQGSQTLISVGLYVRVDHKQVVQGNVFNVKEWTREKVLVDTGKKGVLWL
jgi:hypothetical protein